MGLSSSYTVDANGNKILHPIDENYAVILEVAGVLSTGDDQGDIHVRAPGSFRIQKVLLTVVTAPTGADLIVNVTAGGTDMFAAGDRPTIAAGATSGESSALVELEAVRNINEDTAILVDIDQVGSGVAGANLAVHLIGQAL